MLFKLSPVKKTNRSLYLLALTAASWGPRRSGGLLLALIMTRRLRSSIAFPTPLMVASSDKAGGCPWKSIAGNFARGTRCSGTLRVERGLYSRMVGGGNSGVRPSPGRGRVTCWAGRAKVQVSPTRGKSKCPLMQGASRRRLVEKLTGGFEVECQVVRGRRRAPDPGV